MSEVVNPPAESNLGARSAEEYKAERLTWFALVAALVIGNTMPGWLTIRHGFTPLAAGVVLLVSSGWQFRRGWRVGNTTWVAATLMLLSAGFSFFSRPDLDLSLVVILVTVSIIAAGIFTRET